MRQYFTRRLTRLEPPYIVNLIIFFTLLVVVNGNDAFKLIPHLSASTAYLHNIIYSQGSTINTVAWSLEIELQFYLLAPFITYVFKIREKIARRMLIITFILFFSILGYYDYPRFYGTVISYIQFFLAGFLLVDVYLNELKQYPTKSLCWDLVSVVAWLGVVTLMLMGKAAAAAIVVPIFIAYYAAFKGVWTNRFFCQPFVYTVGGMCYTMYLYHYLLISFFGRFLVKMSFLLHIPLWINLIIVCMVLLPLILLFTAFMFVLVEKPCMNKDWYLRLIEQIRGWCRTSVVPAAESDGPPTSGH